MPSHLKSVPVVPAAILTLLIGLLVLQALAYGLAFAFDPQSSVGEFGYEAPTAVDDLTVALVGLVGVGMVGAAALLVLSAILVWRANPAGAWVAGIVGGAYVLSGLGAFRAQWWWDAYFYGITGAALVILAAAVHWLQARKSGQSE